MCEKVETFKFLVQAKIGFCDDDVKNDMVNLGGVTSMKILYYSMKKKKSDPECDREERREDGWSWQVGRQGSRW